MTVQLLFPGLIDHSSLAITYLSVQAAYIDPNTGGMLFQILAVLFGVISGMFLFFSGRIKNAFYKFRRRLGSEKENPSDTKGGDEGPDDSG